MPTILDPSLGLRNPPLGLDRWNNSNPMAGKKKTRKVPSFMRQIVAENLKKLLDEHYKDEPNITAKQTKFFEKTGLAVATQQRIIVQENGLSLDTLETIASGFDLSTYQLLLADLDVKNPQVAPGAAKGEQRAYRRWQQRNLGKAPLNPQAPTS